MDQSKEGLTAWYIDKRVKKGLSTPGLDARARPDLFRKNGKRGSKKILADFFASSSDFKHL
jgi:hypothetical protein